MADPGWIGRLIDGRYAVEAVIGQGGMGMVLRARHRFTGDIVAVKVLRPELGNVPELQQRFLAEARAPSSIGHAGIVKIIDAGKSPEGMLYLVMELLVGRPLSVAMQRTELTPKDMRRVLLELLDALVAAHNRGFVHRDLKPDNVFLADPGGVVKLLDFGIAKVVDNALPKVRTATGSALGTPAYMSPEQIREPSRVDARTDLWSVGVIVFEMLTGRLPFDGDSVGAILAAVTTRAPLPITQFVPDASPQLQDFFRMSLAREPKERYASAAEMKLALWQMPFGVGPEAGDRSSGANLTLATGASYAPPRDSQPLRDSQPMVPGAQPVVAVRASHLAVAQSPITQPPVTQPPVTQHHHLDEKPARSATPIVIALVGVLGIAAVVLAIVLTRQPQPAQPGSNVAMLLPDAATVTAAIVDAAAIVAVDAGKRAVIARDAGAKPLAAATPIDARARTLIDAAVVATPVDAKRTAIAPAAEVYPDKPGKQDPPASPVVAKKKDCIADCAALHRCGVAMAKCVPECQAGPVQSPCASLALANDCDAAARCEMRRVCGSRFATGTQSCKASLACQLACGSNRSCQCTCAANLAPKLGLSLARVDICYWNCAKNSAACAADCTARYVTVCEKQ